MTHMSKDFGLRKADERGGPLAGWDKLGVGIVPIEEQIAAVRERGTDRLQFDFNRGYYHAPQNLDLLNEFPGTKAVMCDAGFPDSGPLNGLSEIMSFRDHVFNRTGLDWSGFKSVRDLRLYAYEGKHHPDYSIFEQLAYLHVSGLPKRYQRFDDLPLADIRELRVEKSSVTSFNGLERSPHIQSLRLLYCRSFESTGLEADLEDLREVLIYRCPKVVGMEFVQRLPRLETLILEGTGAIKSFEPLRGHPSIRRVQALPVRGAKIPEDLIRSLPSIEFVSPSLRA